MPQHLGGGGGATLVLGGDHSGGGGRRPQMTQRDFPSPPLTTDYRASPEDPPPNVLATQKAGSPHPTPLLLPSHGIGFQRKEFGDFLGRKIRFEIGFVIRGKGRKKGIFGLVEIGFSKFIYVRQGCLVVAFFPHGRLICDERRECAHKQLSVIPVRASRRAMDWGRVSHQQP